MSEGIFGFLRHVRAFIRENGRYGVVLGIFLIATFYSLVIVKEEGKMEAKEKGAKEEQVAQRLPDINHLAPTKAYRNVFDSRLGDIHRVILRLEASEISKVDVFARSVGGKLLPIASFEIPKGEMVFREAVFLTDGEYRDVVVSLAEKRDDTGRQWDDTRVFVDPVSATRLSVRSLADGTHLRPTAFGEPTRVIKYLPVHQDAVVDDSFGKQKNRIGQYFKPINATLSGLRFRGEAVGTGGIGSYVAELGECADDVCDFNDMKTLEKISFHVGDLDRYRVVGYDDVYELPFSTSLDSDKFYYTGISAAKTEADKDNYLALRKFSEDNKEDNSFFGAVFLQRLDILSSAIIEDVGDSYRYEYRMRNAESDMADIHEVSGRVKFDKSLAGLAMPQGKDVSMTFRVNTVHPIVSMRMSAEGIETKSDQFVMEYSFDTKEWVDIPYIQQEDASQVFDAAILATGKSVVYIRARSVQDGSKFKDWGIKDLAVSAVLEKE